MIITGWETATAGVPERIAQEFKAAAVSAFKKAGANGEEPATAYSRASQLPGWIEIVVDTNINGQPYYWANAARVTPA